MKHFTALFSLALSAIALIVVTGCARVPVDVNAGTLRASTFSFMDVRARATPAFADGRAEMHAAIQEAITLNLDTKGLTRVDQGGDLTVGYLVLVASNVMTTAIDDYFGYGADNAALLNKAHTSNRKRAEDDPKNRIRNPQTHLSGALVIDVLDPRSAELQYRNFAVRELLQNPSAEVRAERLQEAVDEILGDLRVKPGR